MKKIHCWFIHPPPRDCAGGTLQDIRQKGHDGIIFSGGWIIVYRDIYSN